MPRFAALLSRTLLLRVGARYRTARAPRTAAPGVQVFLQPSAVTIPVDEWEVVFVEISQSGGPS
jgi:hypothetical protein